MLIFFILLATAMCLILSPFSACRRIRRQERARKVTPTGTADALDAAVTSLEAAFPKEGLTRL